MAVSCAGQDRNQHKDLPLSKKPAIPIERSKKDHQESKEKPDKERETKAPRKKPS
jgi:hypothetical protein